MNVPDSLRTVLLLFDAHIRRDFYRGSKHHGSKRRVASKTLIRERRKAQRQARRRRRLFAA